MSTEIMVQEHRTSTLDQPHEILICLLGRFRLLRLAQPLNLLIGGKATTLLCELALRLDQGVPRDELLEILWPDQDFVHATVSLNSLTYNLQRRLRHQCGGVSPLICANGYYSLNKDAGISTDIAKFDAQVFRGARQSAIGNDLEAKRAYELAVGFYGGDLCTGSNVFSVIERERLRASFLSVLAWLADHAYRDQDNEAALHYALLLLKCDPCREDAHRLVMRIRVQRGERAEALRHYRVCEQALRQEFDAAPEALTHELFELIRAGSGQG